MALSFFDDQAHPPSEDDLKRCLGAALSLWREVQKEIASREPGITAEWGYTGRTTGWGLRLKLGKRVVLYMTPGKGEFLASLALGEKAVAAAGARRLPLALRRILDAAPRYAEGRGVRVRVKRASDVKQVALLVGLKLSSSSASPAPAVSARASGPSRGRRGTDT